MQRIALAELKLIFESAGLEVVEMQIQQASRPLAEAWRPVIGYGVEPDAAVPLRMQGWQAEIDRLWISCAENYGVIGGDHTFLATVSRPEVTALGWTRVRWRESASLAEFLTDDQGHPEFLTMSNDGEAICGVTEEECEVWIVGHRFSGNKC